MSRSDRVPPALWGGCRAEVMRYAPGERQRSHAHPWTSVTLVLRGGLEERVGRVTTAAGPLGVVVKPAGLEHGDQFGDAGATTLRIVLSRAREQELGACGHPLGGWRWIHAGPAVRPMLALLRAIETPAPRRPAPALDDLLIEALAGLALGGPDPRGQPPGWLRMIRATLEAECVPIGRLAAEASVHPVHAAREFRRHFGVTPSQYRRQARLRRACTALAGRSAPLAEAAAAAGYADQAHMTRELRAITGLTPLRYRRLAAGL